MLSGMMDFVTFLKPFPLNCGFRCGFFEFGSFDKVFEVLGLFFLFRFGLKLFQFTPPQRGFVRILLDLTGKFGVDGQFSSKISSCKCGLLNFRKNTNLIDKMGDSRENFNLYTDSDEECDNNDEDEHECDGDENFNVVALKRLIKIERLRANAARAELEKERAAAATAAEEVMAMLLRLQIKKSLIEMEANRYRRLAEEKQLHDHQVIQCLQWFLLIHDEGIHEV
ncbi:protein FLOURY 1-like [Abeliophyllum distichum]|uniref:Protein FLOURY 1-like n=1 Tax=Abeliophyllum distichum TaxID=126358 RepID=A0ABD1TGW1_9LAMI